MKKLSYDNLSSLTGALSHLIHAGIGAADGLYLLSEDEQDKVLRQILTKMAENADQGTSLAGCFQQAGVFPGYLCALLQVGEQVGKTEQTLFRLSKYYQGMARLQRQLRAVLIYPAVLLCVLLCVMLVLMVWVLPVFDGVYAQLGGSLTGLAGAMMAAGQVIGGILPYCGGILALLLVLLCIRPLRKRLIQILQRLWGDRGAWKAVNDARFLQALSLGISSGMSEPESAKLASTMAEVPAFQSRCAACISNLEAGDSLKTALLSAKLTSPAEGRLLEAGIRSGREEQALESIADRMLERSEERVASLAEKAEPAAVLLACLMIGLILLSVMLPLLNIMHTIG